MSHDTIKEKQELLDFMRKVRPRVRKCYDAYLEFDEKGPIITNHDTWEIRRKLCDIHGLLWTYCNEINNLMKAIKSDLG